MRRTLIAASLLLALTDQFDEGVNATRAQEIVARVQDAYNKLYCAGIVCVRRTQTMRFCSGIRARELSTAM